MNENPEIELARQCIEQTGTHLFLTGKAGTGKTTFLRNLKEHSPKRMIVVAPTGIAAINAAGVTIHSFFQLSFAPFLPDAEIKQGQSLYRFSKEKINIIRSIDLLVIDEISMVRADLLDAIDAVLRRYRDRYKPFGGVQLLMIGDLQQLAPVVKDEEWALLSRYYHTPFFFGSHALRKTEYLTIQLQKVYRQSDDSFLSLLNRIRINDVDDHLIAELNKRYIPHFQPREEEGYVRLTTHNYQAQRINERELTELPTQPFTFKAEVSGTFPETSYPAEAVLRIKRGAQIMFIKNDSSGNGRFYNGKIGVVTAVTQDCIVVWGKGDAKEFVLTKEEWQNSKYSLNPDTNEITEEVEGVFRQYPIRLAWAITIHKSQGLTFDKAIIDAKMSFAHGQVYVALSRCRTLEGMVLGSPLTRDAIIADDAIDEFTKTAEEAFPDASRLNRLKQQYYFEIAKEQFGFSELKRYFIVLQRLLDEFLYNLYPRTLEAYKLAFERFENEIDKVANNFQNQYAAVIDTPGYAENEMLQSRFTSGAKYFREKSEEILLPLVKQTRIETDNKELRKRFDAAFASFREQLQIKLGTLAYTAQNGFSVTEYLKCKSKIIVAFSAAANSAKTASSKAKKVKTTGKSAKNTTPIEVSSDILHPVLYKELVRWRNGVALKLNVPVYMVLRQKALLGIANTLPSNADALRQIPYFGDKGVDKYGDDILRIVAAYAHSLK